MKYYLFVTAIQSYLDNAREVLVATSFDLGELTKLSSKFNKCEYYIMSENDEIQYSSWEKLSGKDKPHFLSA